MSRAVRRRHTRGLLVWVALALLVALAVIGAAQRAWTGHVTLAVARSMAGDRGLSLAQSVLEESMHQVRLQANDPASPLSRMLRRPVPAPDPGPLRLTPHVAATESERLTQLDAFRTYSFTGPQVDVLYQRQFEDLPDERFGLIHHRTRVAGAVGSSDTVVREAHAYQEFKTVLITTPRPFDELPFYFGRASALTDLKAANEHRQALLDLYARARADLVRLRDAAAPGRTRDDYERMLASARPVEEVADSAPAVPDEPDAHVTAIWLTGQAFALESMDLARRLQEALPVVQRLAARFAASAAAAAAAPADEPAQARAMADGSETLTAILREGLRLWGFARAFQFILPSEPQHAQYEAFARARLMAAHFRRIAFFVLREDPAGGPEMRIQAQWERLLKRVYTPIGLPQDFNGVVLVENEREPLVLTGDLHGKMIVAATRGGLVLEDVNPRAGPDESLVAVCLGGPLTVSGTASAAVVAAPLEAGDRLIDPLVRIRPGAHIHGGLLVPLGVSMGDWHGTLTYDDKYYAGPSDGRRAGWPDHYYVGVGPRTVFRTVTRK
jgi:hypothetical protein